MAQNRGEQGGRERDNQVQRTSSRADQRTTNQTRNQDNRGQGQREPGDRNDRRS